MGELPDGGGAGGLDRVGYAEEPGECAVDGDIEDGLAIGAHGLGAGGSLGWDGGRKLLHEGGVADGDSAGIDIAEDPASGTGLEIVDAMRTEQRGLGGLHDGRAQRMLAEDPRDWRPRCTRSSSAVRWPSADDGLEGGTAFG